MKIEDSKEKTAELPAGKTGVEQYKSLIWVVVALLLGTQWGLAQWSLRRESPTIDEVIHLPAGISYWQTGKYRLYHHNPPLVKLLAAWPVLGKVTPEEQLALYQSKYWTDEPPNKAGIGHEFARLHATDYFELFTTARSVIPTFLVIGGLIVFVWSRSIYGDFGGLLSLCLWVLCPNLMAHGRLITTDVASAALGTGATYLFVRYCRTPTGKNAAYAGLALGIGLLTKFSLLVLVGLWPLIWLVRIWRDVPKNEQKSFVIKALPHIGIVTLASMLVVNAGYGFEGTGRPLGKFEFYSRTLTRELPANKLRLHKTSSEMLDILGSHRVNRFRGGLLGYLPCPLPAEFMLGFDEQKIDAEGMPARYLRPNDPSVRDSDTEGYPVYLNGVVRGSGWWYYYPYAFLIKTPPGYLLLIASSLFALVLCKRNQNQWFEEIAMLVVPVSMILAMTFLTDINIGLRYILPALPYLYIGCGRLAPWLAGIKNQRMRYASLLLVVLSVGGAGYSNASVTPHYLAYFNVLGGGPEHGDEHLIDSNLDWGQDLVNLKAWLDTNAPGQPVGIAYFGQINPDIFRMRGTPIDWYLPPARLGTMPTVPSGRASGTIKPGYYAVSASLAHGLPWRVYDASRWAPFQADKRAFDYFLKARPVAKIGWSIFIYKLDESTAKELEVERATASDIK